jgi:hypothetical protein
LFVLCISCVYPVYILCISCVYPVCVRHPILSTSSVLSYLRSYLTADSRTSLVPAILHFYFHFYYFIILMFERFMNCIVSFHIVCRLRYTASGAHPVCILVCILCVSRHSSGTQSFLHLRSNLTFGQILPRILEQVLCPRYSTFISIFITFIS